MLVATVVAPNRGPAGKSSTYYLHSHERRIWDLEVGFFLSCAVGLAFCLSLYFPSEYHQLRDKALTHSVTMPGNLISITPEDLASWPKPNYINPEERTWLPAYSIALYAVSTVMVATRLWLRLAQKAGAIGLDDVSLFTAKLSTPSRRECSTERT